VAIRDVHARDHGGNVVRRAFGHVAHRAAHATGQWWAFTLALFVILAWLVTGPLFGFSDTWQLFINTGTTIVTFLMVFLIQHTQNKDTIALQMKLNELIAAQEGASNRLIDIEDLGDEELEALHERFRALARDSQKLHERAATSVEREIPSGPARGKGRKR
jgi:low affinity Fe/Cu permease